MFSGGSTGAGLDAPTQALDAPLDEVIVTGQHQALDHYDIFVLRGEDSHYSYHFNNEVFDNESDWLNRIWQELLDIAEHNSPITPTTTIHAPLITIDTFRLLPLSVRRGIIHFFIDLPPTPGHDI